MTAWQSAPEAPGWWWLALPGFEPVPVFVATIDARAVAWMGNFGIAPHDMPGASWARIDTPLAPCHRTDCVTTAPAPDCPAHGTHPALDWPAR